MNSEMMQALKAVAQDRGVDEIVLLQALADALVTAYKRFPESAEEAEVVIDPESGDIRVMAQELDEDDNVIREWDDTRELWPYCAQTAKKLLRKEFVKSIEKLSLLTIRVKKAKF
jgi:N utilization substance protein A